MFFCPNPLFQKFSSSVQPPFSKVFFLCPIPLLKGCVLLFQSPFSKVLFLCPTPFFKGFLPLSNPLVERLCSSVPIPFFKCCLLFFQLVLVGPCLFQRFFWLPQEVLEDLLEVVFMLICTSSLASSFASVMACTAVFKTSWIAFKLASVLGPSPFPRCFFTFPSVLSKSTNCSSFSFKAPLERYCFFLTLSKASS